MAELDLAAERAKRNWESKTLTMRQDPEGPIVDKYELASEVPVEVFDAGSKGQLVDALRGLFLNPDEADEFMAKYHPSMADLGVILSGLYGLGELGERLASGS